MALWDKLKFWEKEELPSTGTLPSGFPETSPETPDIPGWESETAPPKPMPTPEPYDKVQPIERQQPPGEREHEVINLKLDAIKNALESINMRLERLERLVEGKSEKQQHKVWYR